MRLLLLARPQAERFRDGLNYKPAVETPYAMSGSMRQRIAHPGDFLVILENRGPGSGAAQARLRVEVVEDENSPITLSPRRRAAVVTASLLFFFGVCAWSGRRLWRATLAA